MYRKTIGYSAYRQENHFKLGVDLNGTRATGTCYIQYTVVGKKDNNSEKNLVEGNECF